MLRPNAYSREVRNSHYVLIPNCSEYASETQHPSGDVSEITFWTGGVVHIGREDKPNKQTVFSRCGVGNDKVLLANNVQSQDKSYDGGSKRNITSSFSRGRENIGFLDNKNEQKRAFREIMRCCWAATGTMELTPVLGRLTGTTLRLTRTTTSGGGSSVATNQQRSALVKAMQADLKMVVSRKCPPSGNTIIDSV